MKRILFVALLSFAALFLCAFCSSAQDEKPVVYFTDDISPEGLTAIYYALDWAPEGKVAVKLSTGESDKTNYLRPELIGDLVQMLDATIVECNTAYGGSRAATAEHYQVAEDRGYTAIANFQILDEDGSMELPVNGTRIKGDLVGSHMDDYDDYVILSHFKGHSMAGYGGAIKNISIGLASAKGKVRIHSGGTSDTRWHDELHTEFLEAMAEASKAVADHLEGHIIYINVMNRLSIDCDCDPNPSEPDIHDIGILASYDPVALDQACLDLIYKAEGNERFLHRLHELTGEHTLEHAVEMGLGSREYKLVDLKNDPNNVYTPFEPTDEKIDELIIAPQDEAETVDAMETYKPTETWAVYVYMIGSDLESNGMDNLSGITKLMTQAKADEIKAGKNRIVQEEVIRFMEEVQAKGMDLPSVLYLPTVNYDEEYYGINPDNPNASGYATADFNQLQSVKLPENVKVVIQTGGAKRWQNVMINPNRTQRFLLDETGTHEVYNVPAIQMSDPDSLADFLSWSIENYPADHTMVMFWDHGGAYTGYGSDEIFGKTMSLQEIHDAFEKAVGSNPDDPYFEAIGFDACLMANTDVAHSLYGFAKYLLASEETEPGSGWSHDVWLKALADHPEMNGAQLGKAIADSYLAGSLRENAEWGYVGAGTFSVVDLNEAEALYQAYATFAKKALEASIKEPFYLASLTTAANRSVFYAGSYYKFYNTLDLGLFMDNVPEAFADAAAAVKNHLEKAVLYHAGSGYLSESQGISVYYPAHIEDSNALEFFLQYVNRVSDNKDINALYYYKVAGCLNDELASYAASEGFGTPENLDFSILRDIPNVEMTADENGDLSFSLTDEQLGLVQDVRMNLAHYNEETGDVTYFGEDNYITMSDDNTLVAAFDGEWISMNDIPLPMEVIDSTEEYTTYTVPMRFNGGVLVNFTLSYHYDTQKVDFLGIRTQDNEPDLMGRALIPMKPDSEFAAVYEMSNLNDYGKYYSDAAISRTDSGYEFSYKPLPDGTYLGYVVVEDLRSDKYYTPVFRYTMKDGKIVETAVMEDLFAYDDAK